MRLQLTADSQQPVRFADEDGDGIDDDTGLPVEQVEPVEDEATGEQAGTRDGLIRYVLAVEDAPTGDGRVFEAGSLWWEEMPPEPPFMATDTTSYDHLDARLVGHIVEFAREGNEIVGYVRLIAGSTDERVLYLQRLIEQGELPGVSVDADAVEGVMVMPGYEELEEPADGEPIEVEFRHDDYMTRVTSARIRGATAVPFPALVEATQEPMSLAAALPASLRWFTSQVRPAARSLRADAGYTSVVMVATLADGAAVAVEGGLPVDDLHVTLGYYGDAADVDDATLEALRAFADEHAAALAGVEARVGGAAQLGDDDPQATVYLIEAQELADARTALEAVAAPDATHPHFTPHVTIGYGVDWPADRPASIELAGVELWVAGERYTPEAEAMVAAIAPPVDPPEAWFADPTLDEPTPITVTDDGRVFGHLALWDSCHVGFASECVTPPPSKLGYSAFTTGELVTAEGSRVRVGQITTSSGHAPLKANAALAKEHYDHTGWAAADVAIGEDAHGIWLAGAVRSTLSREQLREFLAADVSGDWRTVNGSPLELVGIASINVPGFHKLAAQARVASGAVQTLVAAAPTPCGRPRADQVAADRIALSVGRHPAQLAAARDALAARIGRDFAARRLELASRVRGDR